MPLPSTNLNIFRGGNYYALKEENQMTTDVAEDFEDDFERNKVLASHRLRCLSDVAEQTPLQIYRENELVGIFMAYKLFIDADHIELISQTTDKEGED